MRIGLDESFLRQKYGPAGIHFCPTLLLWTDSVPSIPFRLGKKIDRFSQKYVDLLIFLLLHYYAVSVGVEPTFWDYLSVSSSRVKPLLGQLDP
jgi:hypothetical protein